jgi:XapX domain-containing protein
MHAKVALGLLLGFLIGAGCEAFVIPSPAPSTIMGAALVVAMTVGYVVAGRFLVHPAAATEHLCGGPTVRLSQDTDKRER